MNENIIQWNVTNWVTVILMAAIGFFLLGLFLKWKQSKVGNKQSATSTPATVTMEP